ncbi:metabotropic glutamate receptor 6-like isoform X3 [Periplaneta americana]|uniref:metabotropic glutamate receptor 6-like isoform X3 n=1 Tax=Periplaneta americana TaxID=6978 RepID=UPI0037E813AF
MLLVWWFAWLGLITAPTGAAHKYLNYTGDIMLGALFPIHHRGSGGNDCGKVQLEDGIQPLEAMLYTLEQINNDPDLLPGIKLGMIAFDSCDSPAYGLEQSLDFVKGFIAHFNEFHEHEFQCQDGSTPKFRGGGFDRVVAVIGAQSSSVTIQVATMLRLFRVPQISYMATSPSLSDPNRFPYFFRTVPSDLNQAHAMLEILRKFNWTYVSVVHSDNEYGTHGYETLRSLAASYNVCFSAPQRVDKEHFGERGYDIVLDNIVNKTEVRVVVVFADKSTTQKLMDAARHHGVVGRFVWIVCDAWSAASSHRGVNIVLNPIDTPELVSDESILEGALAVQPLYRNLAGFDDYFKSLNVSHNTHNPWFEESLKEYCRRQHSATRYRSANMQFQLEEGLTTDVSADEVSTLAEEDTFTTGDPENCDWQKWRGYRQQRYLHFVRDAVYAVAQALHNLQAQLCPGVRGMCKAMRHIDGDQLRTYLSNVTFNDEGGKPFMFMDGRDGPPRYSILNFQKDERGNRYHWKIVGNYTLNDEGLPILNIDNDTIRYRSGENFPPSACATPCAPHQVKIQQQREDTCCWRCRSCGEYQVKVNDYRCEDCPMGFLPSRDHSKCLPIPEEFIDYQNPWAIAAMAVASLGILVTVFVLVIFWTYSDTPIVKASGRELSYLLLVGTLASFCVTFVIVARPTPFTCGLTRFFLGFCYTLCYAAIVTKTNRISRIFNNRPISPHKTRYTSPTSQLVITALLTSVEVVINVSWLMYEPPHVTHSFPTRESRLLICEGLDDYSYMVGLLYPFVLIGLCTAYAVKTRKCPGGFNETRHIAFTNYTAIIIWLAFVPLYLASTSNSIRVVTLAISLSLSGLVQLGCLFFPKLYIVLFKPEKNTKEVVMSQHRSSSYLATPTPTNLTPVAVVVNGGMHYVQNNDELHSDVTANAGSVVAELNRKAQQQKLRPQYSPQVARQWRGKPSPTASMGRNSPALNQSSTNSIREEDSIDISEQASTKSSPA